MDKTGRVPLPGDIRPWKDVWSGGHSVGLIDSCPPVSELVDRVSRGEEFVITRHDTEIARLVSVKRPSREHVGAAIAKLRASRKGRTASIDEILSWKNEGRR